MSKSWGDMFSDIGFMILNKLPEAVEHIRFGAACKQWRTISKEYQELNMSNRKFLPLLLVPSPDAPSICAPPCVYSLSSLGKYYTNIKLRIPFNCERYCGSSYGWIAIQNEDLTITLIYPFGEEVLTIHLPGIQHWSRPTHYFDVDKVFISPDSTPDNYTVVAIYGGRKELVTIRSGEDSWEYIPGLQETAPASLFTDVIFYQGGVYASSKVCMIVKVDIHVRPPVVRILHPLNRKTFYKKTYLVESTSSDLLFIQRRHNIDDNYPHKEFATVGFNFFKIKLQGGKAELMDQKSLNGDAIFVGDNTSLATQATGCQGNSIYFTDDLHDVGHYKPSGLIDTGCYSVEDETLKPFYSFNPAHKTGVAPPIWISPH